MKIFIVSHTHWDREWYLSFEENRNKLIKVLDEVIKVLEENEKFNSFILDGQTIILEDYLEIKPENKERIKKLVKNAKLLIGPFYVQPDEFLISGESLIRNLLIGIKESKKFGNFLKIGYLVDTFGHIPILPRILRGFGIKYFLFSRGLGDEADNGLEFKWFSPDGSYVICYYLIFGYCTASSLGLKDPYDLSLFEFSDYRTIILNLYYKKQKINLNLAYKKLINCINKLKKFTKNDFLLLMNGCDHLPVQENIVKIIEYANNKKENEFIHSNLFDFFKYLENNSKKIIKIKGELRGSKYMPILNNVFSTRVYLKQLNFKSQAILEKYLEPLSVIYFIKKRKIIKEIENIWKILIQNHFHDSIYGSGIDRVHKENELRFLKVLEISNCLIYDILNNLENKENERKIIIFNPLPFKIKEYAEVWIKQPKEKFVLKRNKNRVEPFILERYKDKIKICFIAEALPLGFTIYEIKEEESLKENKIKITKNKIENDFFIIEHENKGFLKIKDKETNNEFILYLIDEIDLGDEYNSEIKGISDNSYNKNAYVALTLNKNFAEIIQKFYLNLKEENEKESRSIPLNVELRARIYEKIKRIEFKIKVLNRSKDHRLRLKIELPFKVEKEYAETPFYVIERESKKEIKENWIENQDTRPFLNFVDFYSKHFSLALVTKGLHEYEVNKNNIYLTLFRAIRYLSRDRLKNRKCRAGPVIELKDSQCIREMEFEFCLIPHKNKWIEDLIHLESLKYLYKPICIETNKEIKEFSFLNLKNKNLILSSMKLSEDNKGIILRFYNINNKKEKLKIKLFKKFKIFKTNLNEKNKEKINLKKIKINKNDILTLFLK